MPDRLFTAFHIYWRDSGAFIDKAIRYRVLLACARDLFPHNLGGILYWPASGSRLGRRLGFPGGRRFFSAMYSFSEMINKKQQSGKRTRRPSFYIFPFIARFSQPSYFSCLRPGAVPRSELEVLRPLAKSLVPICHALSSSLGLHETRTGLSEGAVSRGFLISNSQKCLLALADSLPLRQKRHKYIKRKAHTVNVVDKKDGSSTPGASGANRKCKSENYLEWPGVIRGHFFEFMPIKRLFFFSRFSSESARTWSTSVRHSVISVH